jgi:hypothetical protein
MAKTHQIQQQQRMAMAMQSLPNAIKTKKFALDKNTYIKTSLMQMWRQQWKWVFVPVALLVLNLILNLTKTYPNFWIYIVVVLGVAGYVAFWAVQFTGVTQLDQYKQLFQRYRYEIDTRQILMRVNEKEGGLLKWDMFTRVTKDKNGYLFEMPGRGQFLYFPFDVFNAENDRKLLDRILREKNLLKDPS